MARIALCCVVSDSARFTTVQEIDMGFDAESKIRDLMANDRARAVLEAHVPGFSTNPQLDMVLDMTLAKLATYPTAASVQQNLQAIVQELAKI